MEVVGDALIFPSRDSKSGIPVSSMIWLSAKRAATVGLSITVSSRSIPFAVCGRHALLANQSSVLAGDGVRDRSNGGGASGVR